MADIEIKASLRNGAGKKSELSDFRGKRALPGVVYGGGKKKKNILILVSERSLLEAIKTGGANAIINLKHDKGTETVIVKDLQRHVVTSQLLHVDFQRVDMEKKIVVKVPIHTVGEAPGVKLDGGVLEHILREIEVEALPGKIPQTIEVDISSLKVGDTIKIKDITVPHPEEAKILVEADQTVMHVVHATIEEEPEPVAEGEKGAEPEVLMQKKADEEGAPDQEADAADGKAAEGGKKPEAGKKAEEKK